MSAPISRNCWQRAIASSRSTHARASVRAMIRMSAPASRASTAARIAHQRLVSTDDRLALGVPAALRRHLVLQHDRGEARARVSLDRPLDVLRAAEAGVAVADERNGDGAADVLPLIDELRIRNQPGVGHAQPGGGHGKATHEADLEARLFDETRRDRVMAPRHRQDARPIEQRAQTSGGSGHAADLTAPIARHRCQRVG